jgi:hypothetical protein
MYLRNDLNRRGNYSMKVPMDKTLKLSVEEEFQHVKAKCPMLNSRQIFAIILGDLEQRGQANRYLRKDGRIGWRATDKMREDLFERMQEAIDEQDDL